ncbi:MgtC/SapB family protein [Aedoeadaptatus coli]|uniref:MgtC/SapB family protein n=1 Tax=Aedoeadaptatus coli TaxID=2058292 RepID=UPI000D54F272|nr:MgtC/SapB family protein [Peptoniphilus coli]
MNVFSVAGRIILAAFLGAIIGMERERKHKAAGFRTHIIVSVGACLIMLIGIDGVGKLSGSEKWDALRLPAQVISGIGFLGAGTILQTKDGVSGLTTAATLWLSAAIGLAAGIGYYEGAVIATVICLITLISLRGIGDWITNRRTKTYIMVFQTPNFEMDRFLDFTSEQGVEVRKLDILDEDMEDASMIESTLSFHENYNIGSFFKKLKSDYHLKSVRLSDGENGRRAK